MVIMVVGLILPFLDILFMSFEKLNTCPNQSGSVKVSGVSSSSGLNFLGSSPAKGLSGTDNGETEAEQSP